VWITFEVPTNSRFYRWELEWSAGGGVWERIPTGQLPQGSLFNRRVDENWTIINYKVTDLEPNMDYAFRVRLLDPNGQPSLWSNVAYHRTDFRQDIYDREYAANSWINFIRNNLWDEMDKNYWQLTNNLLLYRNSRVSGIMASTADSQIYIYAEPSNTGADRLDILLPVNLIEAANRSNRSLIIRNGSLETVIPPNAITEAMNGVAEARQRIRQGEPEDYYVMFSINYTPLNRNPVDGNDVAERQVEIRAQAMTSLQTAKDLDDAILAYVTERLNSEEFFEDVRRLVMSMVEQNISNDEIARHIYGLIEIKRSELMEEARKMYVAAANMSFAINSFARPVLHAVLTENPADIITGYIAYTGNFAPVQTAIYKTGRSVSLAGPGSVLFTVFNAVTSIDGLVDSVLYPGDMATVIAKYNLVDFTGRTNSELNNSATLSAAMNIVARISGAESGSDGIAFMRSNGYTITGRTGSSALAAQEAVYLVMALYEMRLNVSVNSMTIRNQAATAGIQGIDQRYLPSVRAAFELGILTDADWSPREIITMMDFLNMLSRLHARLPL
jgi:hypothetical protein